MPYTTTRQIKQDVLFRGGEPTGGGQWNDKVVDYINRAYRGVASGASEFLPEYVEDWWWTRGRGVLTLLPATKTGTVAVTQGSTTITFSDAPSVSVTGYRFRVDGWSEPFLVASHTALNANATLDSIFTGETNSAATYKLMKTTYSLDSAVQALISPMVGFRNNPKIIGISPERMDDLYPLQELNTGIPRAFALVDEQTVQFSHGGRDDGISQRVEYNYRAVVSELTDSDSSVPLIPLQYRHVLADMALTFVYLDKNDDRSNAVALSARTVLAGMLKDNRRRLSRMGGTLGHIYPRGGPEGNLEDRLIRTDSGLIIGGPY